MENANKYNNNNNNNNVSGQPIGPIIKGQGWRWHGQVVPKCR